MIRTAETRTRMGVRSLPNPGDWDRIWLYLSDGSLLEYCHIRYAGSSSQGAVGFTNAANSTVRRSLVTQSKSSGIRVDGSNPIIEGDTIDRTLNYGIYCSSSLPVIHYNSLAADSAWYGVYTATSTDTIDATYNWWGSNSGPYDPFPHRPALQSIRPGLTCEQFRPLYSVDYRAQPDSNNLSRFNTRGCNHRNSSAERLPDGAKRRHGSANIQCLRGQLLYAGLGGFIQFTGKG